MLTPQGNPDITSVAFSWEKTEKYSHAHQSIIGSHDHSSTPYDGM
ncbi:Uncharacterised protein [Klebsiella michiganensis]|nr:Uncharacterised protein [Klebsiella michiganensis]